jgi:hypothetical protein
MKQTDSNLPSNNFWFPCTIKLKQLPAFGQNENDKTSKYIVQVQLLDRSSELARNQTRKIIAHNAK